MSERTCIATGKILPRHNMLKFVVGPDGSAILDLDYELDFAADVDMNVVMTGKGRFVEIQGTGEEATFSDKELHALLKLGRRGIQQLTQVQKMALGRIWPF